VRAAAVLASTIVRLALALQRSRRPTAGSHTATAPHEGP
jgi:hypothetical protein